MGLSKEQLADVKLEQVEILEFSQTQKDGKEICVLKVTDGNKNFDVGLFDCADEVLDKHGDRKDDKNFLSIPASKIKEDGMVWINNIY